MNNPGEPLLASPKYKNEDIQIVDRFIILLVEINPHNIAVNPNLFCILLLLVRSREPINKYVKSYRITNQPPFWNEVY